MDSHNSPLNRPGAVRCGARGAGRTSVGEEPPPPLQQQLCKQRGSAQINLQGVISAEWRPDYLSHGLLTSGSYTRSADRKTNLHNQISGMARPGVARREGGGAARRSLYGRSGIAARGVAWLGAALTEKGSPGEPELFPF